MKLKSKLILAAASLMVLSGAAAGTSAFAWFTANQFATATASYAVKSNTDDLSVTMAMSSDAAGYFTVAKDSTTGNSTATSTNAKLTDISGSGKNFWKVTFDSTNNPNGAVAITSEKKDGTDFLYYLNMTLTFGHTNGTEPMAVFLSSTSAFSQVASGKEAYKAARLAILSSDDSAVVAYYAPQDAAADLTMLYGTTAATEAVNDTTLTTSPLSNNILTSAYATDATDATASTATQAGYLGQIAAGSASTLVLHARIWLEGTDANCGNVNLGGIFSASLVFNGTKVNA
ncbi:MAG: hypothetical protein LKJ88_05805 [Bacilli bacterium]|jgi:hypothetical protein|nr:hypothetical protein [Bacilli bacterium]